MLGDVCGNDGSGIDRQRTFSIVIVIEARHSIPPSSTVFQAISCNCVAATAAASHQLSQSHFCSPFALPCLSAYSWSVAQIGFRGWIRSKTPAMRTLIHLFVCLSVFFLLFFRVRYTKTHNATASHWTKTTYGNCFIYVDIYVVCMTMLCSLLNEP